MWRPGIRFGGDFLARFFQRGGEIKLSQEQLTVPAPIRVEGIRSHGAVGDIIRPVYLQNFFLRHPFQ